MVACSMFMFLIYSSLLKIAQVQGTHCSISWKPYDLRTFNPPLILKKEKSSSGYDIVLPEIFNSKPVIRVPFDSDLTISCPGGRLKDFLKRKLDGNNIAGITAKCNKNGEFLLSGVRLAQTNMDTMGCTRAIDEETQEYVAQKQPYAKCGNNPKQPDGDLIKIGFKSYGGFFYPQIEVCFDNNLKRTIWTRHTLHGYNHAAHTGPRPSTWRIDELYGNPAWPEIIDWDNIYKGIYQKELFKNKLGKDIILPSGTRRPPGVPTGLFLAKGHLSPNADFVTAAERKATFHYINALPQFQADNNGNWAHVVEVSVKNLAKEEPTDLTIISGGHSILQLKNIKTNKDVAIYLDPAHLDANANLVITKYLFQNSYGRL